MGNKEFNKDDVKIVFYGLNDGIPNMSDSFIMKQLIRAEKDGSLDMFFFGYRPTGEEFLAQIKTRKILFCVIYYQGEITFIGTLDKQFQKSVHCHFCSFSEWWGNRVLIDIASEVYSKLLDIYTVLIGVVPVTNELACRFSKKIGLKELCDIPRYFFNSKTNTAVDGKMFCINREV